MKTLGSVCTWIAYCGLLLPGFVSAESTVKDNARFIQDVALNTQQQLAGQLVDRNGVALADAELMLLNDTGDSQRAITDADGHFAFTAVRGGTYSISSGEVELFARVWTANAAPPAASKGLLMVADGDQVTRGQCNCQNNQCNCQPKRRTPNRKRRRTLARIGIRGAMMPFSMVSAFGAAAAAKGDDDDAAGEEEEGGEEEGGGDNGDTDSAS